MGLANVLYEFDYPMSPGNGASQCALGMGLANVKKRMGLTNMLCEWDYPMCPWNGTS